MLAKDLIIVLVIFGAVITIGYLMVADISNADTGYNVQNMTDEDFKDNFDTYTNSTASIVKMQQAASNSSGLSQISSAWGGFKSTLSIISLIFTAPTLVSLTLANFGEYFGIPSEIGNIVFGMILYIIIIIIVFVVITSLVRGRL